MAKIGAKLCPGLVKLSLKSRPRKHKLGPQSTYRCGTEGECTTVEAGELDHDRKPKAGTGLGLIQAAAAPGHLLALLWRQAWAVVVDQNVHDPTIILRVWSL